LSDSSGQSCSAAVAATQRWLERAVIGLNLCPFAQAVYQAGQIHFAHTPAHKADALLTALEYELNALLAHTIQARTTTLLIAPNFSMAEASNSFAEFNDFLALADVHLRLMGLQGQIQLASFHPQYCFAGAEPGDIGNATNRSPHPTVHLLREASVSQAVATYPDTARIVQRNLQTLARLGHAGWAELSVGPAP
jgi:uncharacterized protein